MVSLSPSYADGFLPPSAPLKTLKMPTTMPSNSSVVQQKAGRAVNAADNRVNQHIDHKVNKVIDGIFR